ncbi:MAG: hypothetical protein AB7F09_06635 [Parvibaculaceae bacterium]
MRGNISEPGSSVAKLRPIGAPTQQRAPETEQSLTTANPTYALSAEEAKLLAARSRLKASHALPAATFVVLDGGKTATVEFDHPDKAVALALYSAALKTVTINELYGILTELSYLAQKPGGAICEAKFNSMVQMVANMRPRDVAETMLCVQMVAIHKATMTYAGRLMHEGNIKVSEAYERSLNKLARTYAAQMTTLKQYRSDGKQKIVVKHVTVNDGGQAIVGDVTHGGPGEGAPEKSEATA